MKTNINAAVARIMIIYVCCVASACNDMMNIDATDFFRDDAYWQTENQAIEAVNGCYRALNDADLYGNGGAGAAINNYECMTPNAYHKDNLYNTHDFAIGSQSATTLGMNLITWRGCYRGIGRCNNVIDKITGISMDEKLKTRLIAEAKFLRALYYHKMNVVFNGVPLVLTPPNVEEHSRLARASYEEVKAQILKDLDEAVPALETKYPSEQDGRATKGAAFALKAKVLLQDLDYSGTIGACESLFALNRYELFPDYNGIFRQANTGNSEVIFDVRWKYPNTNCDYDIIHAQYNVQAPVQELIDAYQMIDGKSITESPLYDSANPYENRDPRFNQTILWIGKPWRNRIADASDLHQTGYGFIKYTEYTATTTGALSTSDIPYVVLRYADVLLMYAEALNELLAAPDEKVYRTVNEVRGRESVNMPPLPDGLTKEQMREAIRLERRIEMAGEDDYFYAIRRWKTIETDMNASVHTCSIAPYTGAVIETRHFNPARDYYWPIPYTEIDLNPELEQNPGY
ncbi:MAG: RagB/SusD family nutrient uptake outer membrane protein [Tannerellaceae bacterium]|jgi:hypothetical protein|nr:RagB/SusD family nutrient uptake outer membrane protein [Tannerellaceae bacterium]